MKFGVEVEGVLGDTADELVVAEDDASACG